MQETVSMYILVVGTIRNLTTIRDAYTKVLEKGIEFIEADEFPADYDEWLKGGLTKSMLRDLEHGQLPGPAIPGTMFGGDDDSTQVPQGLHYDPTSKLFYQTSYDSEGGMSTLTVIDPDTGKVINTVKLGTTNLFHGVTPDHVGGVTVHDGKVYVTSSNPSRVHSYPLDKVKSAAPNEFVYPDDNTKIHPGTGATTTISGDTMYCASFSEAGNGEMYTYTQDEDGKWEESGGPYPVPPKTQGIIVRDDKIIFSTSHGRGNESRLESYDLDKVMDEDRGKIFGKGLGEPNQVVEMPNMGEGITIGPDGQIVMLPESGAGKYSSPTGDLELEDLWGSLNMPVVPPEELGLTGGEGYDVEPVTLKEASRLFHEAEAGIEKSKRKIDNLSLPASSMGENSGAGRFAMTVDSHVTETATWLGRGQLSANLTAIGLVDSAEDYAAQDAAAEELTRKLFPWLDLGDG